ncbi:hypothetical protein [Plantactinospora sp. KBS50]|uniref:hypothetical protein n=1 Tax=Plantactinospora sp. KBS50 TaxID=2024580 RepID=UPI000BAAA95A|nr:hypothetical protein [Plantactinospora sp. KBS50]ASW53679.1 hypothetical protein CIK06_04950 [Plantactinospora sp. KBS50]
MARTHRLDLAVGLLFLLAAGWITHGLWPAPPSRVLALNPADQTLYEWFLASDARLLLGDFSLLSDRLNVPDGVNLMANTTVLALGMVFAPVTLLFGAATTFALIAAGNLAGTAVAWYLLFSRTLRASRLAAALGAVLCGFGPGMVSQSNSHLHMTAQWLVPVMVWLVLRMVRAADPADPAGRVGPDWRRVLTSALGLAGAVTLQVFIGEEVLFLTAVTLTIVTVVYGLTSPRLAWRVLPGLVLGLATAALLAIAVLMIPLWFQFRGPQGVRNGMFSPHHFSADLASFPAFSPLSLAGTASAERLSTGASEYNSFLGWPLLVLALAAALWLARRRIVLACVAAAVVMTALSLGPHLVVNGHRTDITAPYTLLLDLPVVDGALPIRFALAVTPLLAIVLVVALDRARALRWSRARWVAPAVLAAAILPVLPGPLPTTGRPPVPEFFTAGHWRDCVRPTGVLVPVPLPTPNAPWAMRWAAVENVGFAMPEGFFIGPYGDEHGASLGVYKQPTSALLAEVGRSGTIPRIGPTQRERARQDLEFWNASCVVLADDAPHPESLRSTVEALLGPATRDIDVWVWRVR